MSPGAWLIIGILALVVFLLLAAVLVPKLKKYKFSIKKVEPKRRRAKRPKKKGKYLQIRIL